ncbi:YybH family protein [Mycolicibacterium monacense]|uniref:DUF4440 domain-containing protein n=2 Tax=Mycobacteriaceae TaxID=1762 RepID=A0AAD1J4Q7_MYCMB|nr:nuclear transport factor 2 family protein [Mycolicibacterium monacense]MDA4100127.1 hypothetical protein [Mycolicibacterium monacense DSM 44395]OBB66731.1 hypothetical protein A6B34_21135 [Mycolicibacterium monacense]ORB14178.1 hypothetical protein BST34_23555 [Mycolicibacterium monacense DSM 44395]QHP84422.1 DUF4440 domain-containing protein [Mycolicibacterium monacense DSM 44395]BBZ62817.1 hypothetical protein MMON_41180 [Mycolicibacterium monacense]
MGTSDPLVTVTRYIEAFNRGDAAVMASMFDTEGVILDGMAPHVWLGPSAAQDWYRDVLVEGEHHGASDYAVTLGEPLHHNVTGDRAYLAIPARMTFRVRGTPVTQTGAFFTVALRQVAEGWRITAWAWTKGTQQ